MDKQKLIEKMREAALKVARAFPHNDNYEPDEDDDKIIAACAEAALQELSPELERITGLLKEQYLRAIQHMEHDEQTNQLFWQSYKEQHNITPQETEWVSVQQRLPPEKQGGYSDFYEVKCLEDGLIARYSFEHESWQLPNGGGWLNGVTHWLIK